MGIPQILDLREKQRVRDEVFTPSSGVRLTSGLLKSAFDNNTGYLKTLSMDSMLYWFRAKAGLPAPGEPYRGHFEDNIRGQTAGLFMMGAANSLRWEQDGELDDKVNRIIDVIDSCKEDDGYLMAVPKSEFGTKEYPNYVRCWLIYGLLAAGLIGKARAYSLLRNWQDWFNDCEDLPVIKYLSLGFQGIVGSTNTYLSPVGVTRDLEIAVEYYQEDWRLAQFIIGEKTDDWGLGLDHVVHKRDVYGVEHFPHGTELTALEGYLDLYRATGKHLYLNAVRGAYDMYGRSWQHPGGGIVMIEKEEMFPGCYWLSPERRYNELCCSVFWIYLNQRLHRLFPMEEKYVDEIEKSIYNVAVANQVGTEGIRYHANIHRNKEDRYGEVHCCEGQGTRLFGALPEFLYSLAPDGLYVDIYSASQITWDVDGVDASLSTETEMPLGGRVSISFSLPSQRTFKLRLRIPSWATSQVDISVNGQDAASGEPGSYCILDRCWEDGDTVTFDLPMGFRATRYEGAEQVEGHSRYAFEYGPVLLGVVGDMNYSDGQNIRLDRELGDPSDWLAPGGKPLHFQVEGNPGYRFMPYFEITGQPFTCYPLYND